ncbi:MAG: beta-galactosidase [Verrucomicrobiia bacterium]
MNRILEWRSLWIGIAAVAVVWLASEAITAEAGEGRRKVAIIKDSAVGTDTATTDAIAEALRREKFDVQFLSAEAICDAEVLSPKKHFLYVIPNAASYPASGADALARYLGGKGSLMVLGTPPFEKPIWKHDGRWVDGAFVRDAMKNQKPTRMLYNFETEAPGKAAEWAQSGAYRKYSAAEIVPGGVEGSKGCLKITLDYESGSPTGMGASMKLQANGTSGGLLCFWVKGDGQTARLAVRLVEETEPLQRGIAVISINKNWTYHVLRPEDFLVRGHADPYKARRLSFELVDRTTTPYVADGKHTVWIDQIGTAPQPFPKLGDMSRNPFPLIETVSPGYKLYPLTNIGSLKAVPTQAILGPEATKLPTPSSASSCYARPEGKGFERGYKWRWIPLVRACDKDGVERGTAAWMLLHQAPLSEGPAFADAVRRLVGANIPSQPVAAEGSVCAVCAISDPAALNEIARTSFFGDVARRISDGVFLSHAGSQEFSYWPGEKVRLGAVAVNHGTQPADVHVRIRVCASGAKKAVFEKESRLAVKPGGSATATFEWGPKEFTSPSYVVTTELLRRGKTIDVIAHEMGVLPTEKAPRDSFVTARDGDFWLEGRKWYPVGVNYWPRHSIALEQEDYTFHWLTPGFYNPEDVERDLQQLESMGATFVAIRAHHQNDRRTVLDFLRRCRNHNIRAFLFVQSHVITDDPHYFQGLMMPYHFQEKDVAEFIRATRLAENPTLMGWDLIWEPAGWVFGGKYNAFGWTDPAPYRQRWDADWARWIDERYGSLASAEADWGMSAPRIDKQVTSPSDQQFKEDGPWRVMVSAYRRFMDDSMSRHWNNVRRTIHQLDPNHLISFRQGNLPPIDFTLTATPKHVDFFAMEGYGFAPLTKGTNAAGFVNRYIHFATKGKPYLWVEFGANAWDRNTMQPGEKEIAYQGQCHELIHRVAFETGANGSAPWWLAGGYRISEKSDFGILNPDGTLRSSGRFLQQYAAKFKTPRSYPKPETWFTMDRDAHSGSHWRIIYNEGAQAFGAAAAQGKQLGIRTPGTDTTSADTPLVAVGNTKYNGHNPPKYLDAEFNWFKIKTDGGAWIEVRDGAQICVPRNKPILATASVGNLQEAAWLTPASCHGKPGAAYLAATTASALKLKQPIMKDTSRLEDAEFGESFILTEGIAAETKVELQMTAEGRAWFGEKLRFTLKTE